MWTKKYTKLITNQIKCRAIRLTTWNPSFSTASGGDGEASARRWGEFVSLCNWSGEMWCPEQITRRALVYVHEWYHKRNSTWATSGLPHRTAVDVLLSVCECKEQKKRGDKRSMKTLRSLMNSKKICVFFTFRAMTNRQMASYEMSRECGGGDQRCNKGVGDHERLKGKEILEKFKEILNVNFNWKAKGHERSWRIMFDL